MTALTCDTALDQYYREQIARKAVAKRRAEYAIEALNSFFAGVPIHDVDIPMCRDYSDIRGVSDSTVRRELGVLSAAAHHAVRWRRLTLDKMPSIELPPESPPRRIWLFKDELSALLDCAEQEDLRVYRFCQIAYHTASRKAAVEGMKWDQIDIPARRINLQGAGGHLTKKRRPIVPISENMAEELAELRSQATSEWVLGDPGPIYAAFQRVAKTAGLATLPMNGMREQGQLSPHILRHSRATHLLQDGKSPWAVANLLGDTLTTVLRVYGHNCSDFLEGVVS